MMLPIIGLFLNIYTVSAFYTEHTIEGTVALVGVAMVVAASKIIEELKKK